MLGIMPGKRRQGGQKKQQMGRESLGRNGKTDVEQKITGA